MDITLFLIGLLSFGGFSAMLVRIMILTFKNNKSKEVG